MLIIGLLLVLSHLVHLHLQNMSVWRSLLSVETVQCPPSWQHCRLRVILKFLVGSLPSFTYLWTQYSRKYHRIPRNYVRIVFCLFFLLHSSLFFYFTSHVLWELHIFPIDFRKRLILTIFVKSTVLGDFTYTTNLYFHNSCQTNKAF